MRQRRYQIGVGCVLSPRGSEVGMVMINTRCMEHRALVGWIWVRRSSGRHVRATSVNKPVGSDLNKLLTLVPVVLISPLESLLTDMAVILACRFS